MWLPSATFQTHQFIRMTHDIAFETEETFRKLYLDTSKALGLARHQGLIMKLVSLNIPENRTHFLVPYIKVSHFTYLRTPHIPPYIVIYLVSSPYVVSYIHN
jgi:hypothetical protein